MYTIEYGAPEVKDPLETQKIVGGVALGISLGIGLFYFIRSFGMHFRTNSLAAAPPVTMAPEFKRAEEERARLENLNPIYDPDRRI